MKITRIINIIPIQSNEMFNVQYYIRNYTISIYSNAISRIAFEYYSLGDGNCLQTRHIFLCLSSTLKVKAKNIVVSTKTWNLFFQQSIHTLTVLK